MGTRGAWRACARELAIAAFFGALALIATRPLARDLRGQTLASPDPLIDLWTVVEGGMERRVSAGLRLFELRLFDAN